MWSDSDISRASRSTWLHDRLLDSNSWERSRQTERKKVRRSLSYTYDDCQAWVWCYLHTIHIDGILPMILSTIKCFPSPGALDYLNDLTESA